MKKRYAIWFVIGVLLLLIVFPYAKVELLTINADEKLESFDISYFDNVYCEGTPKIYDCKIYSYQKDRYAKVTLDSLKENKSRRNALISIMVACPVVMDCIRTNHSSVFEYISKCVVLNPKGLKLYKVFYPRSDKTLYTFFLENNALKDPIYTSILYQTLSECHDFDINVFMKELAAQIPTFNAFHTADVYMSSFIDHLPDMSVEAIEEILRIYNRNPQCTNRGRHASDIATVNKYLEDQCSAVAE